MLKIKKGLANILEENLNNDKPEETPQHVQTQIVQTPQPPAPQAAAWQVGDQIGWEEHLIQALAKAPDDVAQKLATCIDREVLWRALLKRRDDPYLKVALLILKK
jgi:hypothetical protein